AEKIFNRLNGNYQRVSQCFNRAHIWAYEEFTKHKIKSLKAWIFFTNAYIIKHRFLWWFHVAPMLTVKNGEKMERLVLDHRYSQGPQTIKEWSNMLVYTHRDCKFDGKFHEYDQGADQRE